MMLLKIIVDLETHDFPAIFSEVRPLDKREEMGDM